MIRAIRVRQFSQCHVASLDPRGQLMRSLLRSRRFDTSAETEMMQPLCGGRRLPTHATGREYSRLKVPNVLANSNAESQRPRRSRASRPRQTLRRLGRRGHSQFLSGTTAGWHCYLSWVPPCRLRGLTSFLLHSLWNWSRLRGRVRRELKDKDFAVSAAMLWSASSRCIESHRYPSCRS